MIRWRRKSQRESGRDTTLVTIVGSAEALIRDLPNHATGRLHRLSRSGSTYHARRPGIPRNGPHERHSG
jgi:hypothetical protein